MADPFDSAWLKWGWAVRHAELLKADIQAAVEEGNKRKVFTTRTEYDPEHRCVYLKVDSVNEIPPQWRLRFGDVLQCYRSCLDHVAWAIYKRGDAPDDLGQTRERYVAFPFKSSVTDFAYDSHRLLPWARASDLEIVRRYQPHQVTKAERRFHVFALLNQMANEDKHRFVRPLLAIPANGHVWIGEVKNCEIRSSPTHAKRVVIEKEAVLHRVYVTPTGDGEPYVEMQPEISAYVAISEELTIHEWLTHARAFAYQLLSEFTPAPSERLAELGVVLITREDGQPAVEVVSLP